MVHRQHNRPGICDPIKAESMAASLASCAARADRRGRRAARWIARWCERASVYPTSVKPTWQHQGLVRRKFSSSRVTRGPHATKYPPARRRALTVSCPGLAGVVDVVCCAVVDRRRKAPSTVVTRARCVQCGLAAKCSASRQLAAAWAGHRQLREEREANASIDRSQQRNSAQPHNSLLSASESSCSWVRREPPNRARSVQMRNVILLLPVM